MSIISDYISDFTNCLLGHWIHDYKVIIKCPNCCQKLRAPINRGKLNITCAKCSWRFKYNPAYKIKKVFSFFVLITCGLISGIIVARLNISNFLTGFYLFFIIPAGAIFFSLLANTGFFIALPFIRRKGIDFSKFTIIVILGFIALSAFWINQYSNYSKETITINYVNEAGETVMKKQEPLYMNYSFGKYINQIYGSQNFQMFGVAGNIPIITPNIDFNMGSFGLTFLILEQIGLIFAAPSLWLVTSGKIRIR